MNTVTCNPAHETQKWGAYEEYKCPNKLWPPTVPSSWVVMPLKQGWDVRLGKMLQPQPNSVSDTLEPYLRSANICWHGVDTSDVKEMWLSTNDKDLYEIAAGDLLVCEGGDVGTAAIWRGSVKPCYIQNAVHRLRPKRDVCNEFLYYWLYSLKHAGVVDLVCNRATIAHLTGDKLGNLPVACPELTEQRAIVAFLDRETAKIDALISAKERQTELLREKRMAIISRAVTKGVDADASRKDSGIEWLAEIPAHWEVKRLRFVCCVQTGITLGQQYAGRDLIKRTYLRVANVQDGYLNLDTITEIALPVDDVQRYELRRGDVLMTEGGDFDKLGRGYVWEGQLDGCLHQNHIFAVRPRLEELEPYYLALLLSSSHAKHYFTRTSQKTTNLATTNITKVRDFPLLLPPKSEQAKILAFVDVETSKIEALIGKIQEHIDKLHEHRTALISAAVTGQIDVREQVVVQQPVVVVAEKPRQSRTANTFFRRQVLAAEIVSRHQDTPRFGRVKLQKTLVLAEYHLGLDDIDSRPFRAAAGPFDNQMMRSIHKQLEKQKWYKPIKTERAGCAYQPMSNCGEHRKYFDRYWGGKKGDFDKLMGLLKPLKTDEAEIVATLYMAWNDFLISEQSLDDSRLIDEVLNNWDPAKTKYQPQVWQYWLDWMRKNELVPWGYGKLTGRRR